MNVDALYGCLADAVLALHVGVVLFVVGGLVLILVGNLLHWHWVNTWWLRLTHLAAIGVVVAESWLGIVCPLTTIEMGLRAKAGGGTYGGSFIGHWLQRLLYYDAPAWVFGLAYSLFALLVVASWYYFPPRPRQRR